MRKSGRKSGPTSPRESMDRRQDTPPSDSPALDHGDLEQHPSIAEGGEETPVIVEPVAIPRSRSRGDRPLSEAYPGVSYYPSSSGTRLADLPSRLSGWFSHTFSSSATDLALPQQLPQIFAQQHPSGASPKGKSSALITAAKHGKGHLDKVMRFITDSDAVPDKCTDSIWLLGVEHPGYEPAPSPTPSVGRRSSVDSRRSFSLRNSLSSSPTSAMSGADPSLSQSQPASSKDPGRHWPPVFYADFTSRIWLTYRSQFHPIRDISLEELNASPADAAALSTSPQPKRWNWPLGGEKCWSSDAGWGCMLRTGQSLLANALIHVHLGRDWRKPPHPVYTSDYATYVQIITWFLDDPSPLCPFSVHRMALVGKQLGVKVGQWFGPSTAAGAIKTLVHAFPEAGLGVHVAADGGTIYESEVFAASHSGIGSPRRHTRRVWGDRAVLILIGHRLGIDGVNPVYYDTLKTLYTWPQSVGIAGGRPSSSYYFVGSQADNLFYLDPHHARPAVPLRPPPSSEHQLSPLVSPTASRHSSTSPEPQSPSDRGSPRSPVKHVRAPTSPVSVRSGSSFSRMASPSPLQHQISTSSSTTAASYVTTTSHTHSSGSHARWRTSSAIPDDSEMDSRELALETEDLDPVQRHYCLAYSAAELKTFHCDRVRKMHLSGLDPSMLIGFLCKDESEWQDLKSRINELNRRSKAPVLHLQDEPPNWNSDSEMGMESISEPDFDLPDEDDEFADADDHMREGSASPDTSLPSTSSKSPEEDDTEDDPVDPITPGPGRTGFSNVRSPGHLEKQPSTSTTGSSQADSLSFDDEDDEEWESSEFTPHVGHRTSPGQDAPELLESQATITRETSESSYSDVGRAHHKKAKKKHTKRKPEQYPFPATHHDEPAAATSERRIPQMRTQKARDGGRTQSGGVRGIPADDLDDA